ncbi:FAD:protein FMN transferase [Flavobacterium sp. DG1-102-2]|uniref:FAD:protein FMN transferase n=1 Tax=Flavobacterium sp. DG1-102-2 TaxID=3081663 RepID=UPI002949CEA3|nr:FAD:protein FMN transferase [Flavobacterium sp. DG1-102-2]MDV6169785.1 FAD:protein FMN transferase [Flavobacterium sp. DG1-102-2]
MDQIWKFNGSITEMPSPEAVKNRLREWGYKNIVLDNERYTIFLAKEGMKIGFGSIGKGYAADKAREFRISKGVKSVIINASGDMNTWGKQPDGKSWTIGVTNPLKKR